MNDLSETDLILQHFQAALWAKLLKLKSSISLSIFMNIINQRSCIKHFSQSQIQLLGTGQQISWNIISSEIKRTF